VSEAERCPECDYSWSIASADAVGIVTAATERYELLLAGTARAPSVNEGGWSADEYLWHVVDVLRFGTDRLWTLSVDPTSGIPGWDQDAMARVRNYAKLSITVGLKALDRAAKGWVEAAEDAPSDAHVEHPVLGRLTALDSIRRNAHEVVHHAWDIEQLVGVDPS
jgi:hypothetical protein